MGDPDVEISVIAADAILFVSVRVQVLAGRDVIEAWMLKITEAFASVERIDGKLLQGLHYFGKGNLTMIESSFLCSVVNMRIRTILGYLIARSGT